MIIMYNEPIGNYIHLVHEAANGRYELTGYDLHVVEAALQQLSDIIHEKSNDVELSNNLCLDLDTFTNQRVFRVRITKPGLDWYEEKSATAAWCMGWIVENRSSPVLSAYKGGTISIIDTRTGLPIYEKAI